MILDFFRKDNELYNIRGYEDIKQVEDGDREC